MFSTTPQIWFSDFHRDSSVTSQPDSNRLMSSVRTMQGCIRSEGCSGRFSGISLQVLCKHPHNTSCVPATSGTSSEDFPPAYQNIRNETNNHKNLSLPGWPEYSSLDYEYNARSFRTTTSNFFYASNCIHLEILMFINIQVVVSRWYAYGEVIWEAIGCQAYRSLLNSGICSFEEWHYDNHSYKNDSESRQVHVKAGLDMIADPLNHLLETVVNEEIHPDPAAAHPWAQCSLYLPSPEPHQLYQ